MPVVIDSSPPKTAWAVLVRAVCCTGILPAQHTDGSKINKSGFFRVRAATSVYCMGNEIEKAK